MSDKLKNTEGLQRGNLLLLDEEIVEILYFDKDNVFYKQRTVGIIATNIKNFSYIPLGADVLQTCMIKDKKYYEYKCGIVTVGFTGQNERGWVVLIIDRNTGCYLHYLHEIQNLTSLFKQPLEIDMEKLQIIINNKTTDNIYSGDSDIIDD